MPNSDEVFAVVTEHLGGNHVRLRCEDGEERLGRIPGRMKYRTWIEPDDIVVAEPWDWQTTRRPRSSGATLVRTQINCVAKATSIEPRYRFRFQLQISPHRQFVRSGCTLVPRTSEA